MEEKVLIKSERFPVLIPSCIIAGIGILFLALSGENPAIKFLYFDSSDTWIRFLISLPFIAFGIVLFLMYAKCELTVTDKRVFGRARFGKRVDLPLDSISAVGTSILKGISVASSSGAISFKGIKNNSDIHREISNLLLERQGKEKLVSTTTIKQEIPQSNADELKKYKDLLDSGVITQEEFDAKKKQLLGL